MADEAPEVTPEVAPKVEPASGGAPQGDATGTRSRRRAPKSAQAAAPKKAVIDRAPKRQIPGNIPYTLSPGVLKRVLEKIPVSAKPPVFNADFLRDVMDATGGSSRPIIPILKNTQMLGQNGVPTELYAQFQTSGGRAAAALQAMRNGFVEIFKRNVNAHTASESDITDIIVAITGLTKADRVLGAMLSTFQTFQEFAKGAKAAEAESSSGDAAAEVLDNDAGAKADRPLHLVYNINVVLPETTSVEVFNAIFKSLKGNLLT